MLTPDNSRVFFKNLDAIRFIAAIMVFLGHAFSPVIDLLPIKNTYWERTLTLISNGGIGVSIFFVLSGFLITYLLIKEYKENGEISLKQFYIRRVLRIWPLYFLVITFTFGIYPLLKSAINQNTILDSHLIYHIFFLSNFDVLNYLSSTTELNALSQSITWSVSIEEQFYLFWPLIFAFTRPKYWILILLVILSFSIGFRIRHNYDDLILYFHTFSVLPDLTIGGILAITVQYSNRFKKWLSNSNSFSLAFSILIAITFTYFQNEIFQFPYSRALSRVFISSSFALVIGLQAFTNSNSILNLGNLKSASKWGRYTYGIYLIHPIVITLLGVLYRLLSISIHNIYNALIFGIIALIGTLTISKLSYHHYELKFLLMKEKLYNLKIFNKSRDNKN